MVPLEELEKLEQYGALRLLVLLAEGDRFVTELIRRRSNPDGIMSQDALRNCRWALGEKGLGLLREESEEGPRARTHLVITEKGRRVAGRVREVVKILKEQ